MDNLLVVSGYNIIMQLLGVSLFLIYIWMFLDRKLNIKKLLIVGAPAYLFLSVFSAWLYITGLMKAYEDAVNLGLDYFSFFITLLLCSILLKVSVKKAAVLSMVFHFITIHTQYATLLLQNERYNLSDSREFLIYTVQVFLASPICVGIVFWILRKVRFPYLLNIMMKEEDRRRILVAAAFILPGSPTYFSMLAGDKESLMTDGLFSLFMLLLFLGFVRYLVMYEQSMDKLKVKEANLLQQQAYIQRLEKMQEEMRLFRHDYKNMLASMYLYAKDGENKQIQEFVQRTIDYIDGSVTEELRQSAQIGNIQITELKSLILTKLMKMNQENVGCHLEVRMPIDKISMETDELCRCMGILIDNAIEAVREEEKAAVDIILSREEDMVTVLISNAGGEIHEFHRIGERGFSTKGKERGLGLYSYHKILDAYDNVFSSTYIKNNCFVQELRIKEV